MAYLDRRHYQLLLAIRKHGRLSLAAQSLGLTQSAASHQIKEAERRLGIRFATYEGRNIVLTAAAERLVKAASYAESTLSLAEVEAGRIYQGAGSTVRIALGFYDHIHWLPAVVRTVQEVFKEISIDIVLLEERNLRTSVIAGIVDLFIGLDGVDNSLPAVPLFADRLVPVGPAPVAGAVRALPKAPLNLAFSRFALLPHQSDQAGVQAKALAPLRAARSVLRVESARAIVELVAANVGTSVLPEWCVAPDIAAGRLVELDAAPDAASVTWHLYGELTQLDQGERILEVLVSALRSAHVDRQAVQPPLPSSLRASRSRGIPRTR